MTWFPKVAKRSEYRCQDEDIQDETLRLADVLKVNKDKEIVSRDPFDEISPARQWLKECLTRAQNGEDSRTYREFALEKGFPREFGK